MSFTADVFQQQIVNFYTNHRTVLNEDDAPPVRVGKQWTARLVAAHFHQQQIDEALAKLEPLTPPQRIAKWSTVLSDIIKSLDEDELAKYAVIAEKWKAEGPSVEVQRRQVHLRFGKY